MDCLPDDLLVQMLSFLPTKQAVSTSLLSKRWRTMFTLTHNLVVDTSIFLHTKRKSFMDFVDRTLVLQGCNHIKKFSRNLRVRCEDKHDLHHWIRSSLKHGVSELHLATNSVWLFVLPSKVFSNTTLVKLSLGTSSCFLSVPSDTYLPALKVLFLDSVWFDFHQFPNVFFPACPALEDFAIHIKSFRRKASYSIQQNQRALSKPKNYGSLDMKQTYFICMTDA